MRKKKSITNVRAVIFTSLCSYCRFDICCTGALSPICHSCPCKQESGDTLCYCLSAATDEELQAKQCAKFEPMFTKHEPVICQNGTTHYFEGYDTSRQPAHNVIITIDDDPDSLLLTSVPERQISHKNISKE